MPLTEGTALGPYQIVAPLGAGGMGEVYRARDARLARDVAVKVLPPAFADDLERLQRFEQEARAAAALNHPNILALYDIGRHEGAPYLVSELLEGTTLRDRIAGGALPVRKAVDYAVQIARGLAAAHEKGIVHRDLKPENVFVTADGRIKILDFGLAKLTESEVALAGVSDVPTTPPKTNPGVVLGTVGYMSPEQVRGTTADARSDIFACGVILYEMLSGRRPFHGETPMDSMTAILKEDPPNLPVTERHIPAAVERIVERCLEKSLSARFQTATDLAFSLDALSLSSGTADALSGAVVSRGHSRPRWMAAVLVTGVAATAAVGAFGLAALYFGRGAVVAPEMRFDIPVTGLSNLISAQAPVAVSPDGQQIAYVASAEGRARIWLRPIGATTARSLAGTDDAAGLFWSPDSRFLAFLASGQLKKIDVTSGSVQTLANTIANVPGTWNRDGLILFTGQGEDSGRLATIARVSASGEDVTTAGIVSAEIGPAFRVTHPQFLPDGRQFLYHVAQLTDAAGDVVVYAGSIDSTSITRVMSLGNIFTDTSSPVSYAAPGYLLFLKNSTLMAQRFDADRLVLSGEPVVLAENVRAFSASDTGVLAYVRAPAAPGGSGGAANQQRLTWFNRSGKPLGEVGLPSTYRNPTLSPDGRRLAVETTESGNSDLWTLDVAKGVPARLTFDPAIDAVPVWSPMGDRVAFASSRGTSIPIPNRLYLKSANGAGVDELLLPGDPLELHTPQAWSPDGRHIVFSKTLVSQMARAGQLWALPLDGDRKPFPLVQSSNSRVGAARFSPDGRWLAYGTNESGAYRVVVRPFPDPNKGTWQVPGPAGSEPKWRRDGRELFYLGMDGTIVAVPVTSDGDQPQFGQPVVLFKTGLQVPATPFSFFYDVAPDGQRFLVNLPVATATPATPTGAPAPPPPITVIVNWTSALVRK